jgi:RNA polymerase sigma-70 factor (ECF subfamily)
MTQSDSSQSADAKPPGYEAALALDWQQELARHQRWLRTVIAARLGSRQAVDEVMQEVSLAAIAQKAPLLDASKVAPWLYRLAATQALLYRRKLGRQRRQAESYGIRTQKTEADSREADPLVWLLTDERRQLVRQALDRLAPRDREILLLKYSEGWNYHQLAAHLGISHSAVETRLHRARARLRNEIVASEIIEIGSS